MARPLRIGIVGAGANTRKFHLPGLRALPGVELAAVANRTRASSERVAAECGIVRVADDWRAIVAAPDIDAICIGTWPYLHAEIAIAALRAGKHVLTEARMARDLAEAKAMLAESRLRPTLVAQIVPAPMSLRYDHAVVTHLASGTLGELREVALTCTNASAADPSAPLTWRQDFALSGKNTQMLGVFYEMALRWLRREPVRVRATARIVTPERIDDQGRRRRVEIPDVLDLTAEYADGLRLTGHFSAVATSPRSEIRLTGTQGGVALDFLANTALHSPVAGTSQPLTPHGPGWNVEVDFVASIRDGAPVTLTDFSTGVAYMRFTEAVWDSWHRDGAWVAVS